MCRSRCLCGWPGGSPLHTCSLPCRRWPSALDRGRKRTKPTPSSGPHLQSSGDSWRHRRAVPVAPVGMATCEPSKRPCGPHPAPPTPRRCAARLGPAAASLGSSGQLSQRGPGPPGRSRARGHPTRHHCGTSRRHRLRALGAVARQHSRAPLALSLRRARERLGRKALARAPISRAFVAAAASAGLRVASTGKHEAAGASSRRPPSPQSYMPPSKLLQSEGPRT
mmetsp:Transcript_111082/g.324928  ORF Transcript_111082/g.324928 Transcript_111082/m.324928 type:complete len:224 (-) Transcript_111082:64-735(-)